MDEELGALNPPGDRERNNTFQGFLDRAESITRGRSVEEQRRFVAKVLGGLVQPGMGVLLRRHLPLNKLVAESMALVASTCFGGLVGHTQRQQVKVSSKGKTHEWKSAVQIEKCRFLEGSGCVGMCVSLCKMPTQTFFLETVGLPLTLEPNFEDLSCTMTFGKVPLPEHLDPVHQQPCLHMNKLSPSGAPCPRIQPKEAVQ
ncbi:CGL5 [Auxenochlorella protothecoides x Auxenochlorella symbiontica]